MFGHRLLAVSNGFVEIVTKKSYHNASQVKAHTEDEVRIVHRSAGTFLEASGWTQLFGQRDAVSRHMIWLEVGSALLKNLDSPPDLFGSTHLRQRLQKSFSGADSNHSLDATTNKDNASLRKYILRHLHSHARWFEEESGQSATSYLVQFSFSYIEEHFGSDTLDERSKCSVYHKLPKSCNMVSPLAIAVAHNLALLVADVFNSPKSLSESPTKPDLNEMRELF